MDAKPITPAQQGFLGYALVSSLLTLPTALNLSPIDSLNTPAFALQTAPKPFRDDKRATIVNLSGTALAGVTVLLTE